MPLYSYECKVCGPFGDWRPLSQSNAKVPLPAMPQTFTAADRAALRGMHHQFGAQRAPTQRA